ncbi:PA2169 family four-helix-bundle protein [Marivirga sp. S37H4]|uniref:PA2169 family four-helix-bundle protein n=1 Tax=Marivirga aurantiaca TaxID=2802615 RepID=A0A934WXI9_9BACT|nr:PA2169 family four-helix-bundle protein [Marivirga aurantiaca]MBK6264690.1 PA2169 family four-helix-bundle protein [Marivirga aurantiaca]
MKDQEIVDSLNKLLTRNYDAEKGYELLADKIEREELKGFFQHAYKERYHFGHEIKDILKAYDAKPDKGTSLIADTHRALINVRDLLTGEDKEAVLDEAIRGEDYAINDYKEVLELSSLRVEHKRILTDHLESIKTSKAELEGMRKTLHSS